ncbi:energy transducer TonB [Parabacteroides sp. Marseille-P3160]|uniref:cell envelope integrity protein TolA n=1 Tax=Parabacteroides sp. Marseille-P3160 TaxID=1917887 RepID=UPI000B41A5DB|nr:energy transducer TonB [Parabacteroides sp. Marseille-P3160]
MNEKKDNVIALTSSVLIHIAIILFLTASLLKTNLPEVLDGGILVNFGTVDAASGEFEPLYTGNLSSEPTAPPDLAPESPAKSSEKEVVTQDMEESVAIPEKKVDNSKAREEARIRQQQAEEQRKADEQKRKGQAISDKVAGAFGGMGNTASNSEGTASSGIGNQGSPFGNSDTGPYEGVGGFGGTQLKLDGRVVRGGSLPRPAYTIQEEGRIVIDILVNPDGDVISATIGKGTNIANDSMRKSALEAARKAKFNNINSVNNQSGTITYRYTLK